MADHYIESSSFLNIPREKLEIARNIVNRVVRELKDSEEGYCGCSAEIEGAVGPASSGVWFHGVESTNVEHVEMIARALIEELEIDEPFFCSWAFTCSKPRIDEFGGGAFVMKRGYQTYWCDARNHVEQQLEDGGMIPLADVASEGQPGKEASHAE